MKRITEILQETYLTSKFECDDRLLTNHDASGCTDYRKQIFN